MADDKADKSSEEEALEKRVDDMMGVGGEDSTPAVSTTVEVKKMGGKDKEEVAKNLKTAPKLPKKLLSDIKDGTVYKPEIPAEPPIVMKLENEETTDKPAEPEAGPEPELEPEADQAAEESEEDKVEISSVDDSATDKAVDDIVAKEGDTLLALDDARAAKKQKGSKSGGNWKTKLKSLLKNKWTWVITALIVLIVFGLPVTRYKILGLAIKKSVSVTVLDSKTKTPVSNAVVQLGGDSVKTDAYGKAKVRSAVGKKTLAISKQYYQDYNSSYFVGFKAPPSQQNVKLVATGRLVPITVTNKVSGKPQSGVLVKVLDTTAKTNAKGQAVIALPTKNDTNKAKLSLSGYNTANVIIQVTDKVVKANTFEVTPAGHIYFLSNLSGNLDVVKANLDGSGRKTVLAGTGREDTRTTSLLASRDWRYLVLKARRDGSQAALYLIDTSTDKVTQFDNGNAEFNLVGWYGHSFIYELTRNGQSEWQASRQVVKSYDAENLQLNQLDQNQAEGDTNSYANQNFTNFYILNGVLVYNTQWYGFNHDTNGKTGTIRAVQPNGQGKKDYQSFPTDSTSYIQASLYEPQAVYYAVNTNDGKTTFYEFENQSVKTSDIDANTFSKPYPTFLVSPNGNQTFWTELRDGKNTLFTGNSNAEAKKQIASSSDYTPYGWYSDSYVLVSKNSSQLYIMPASGQSKDRQPLKITDYYKPAQTYTGYGYGYGGL